MNPSDDFINFRYVFDAATSNLSSRTDVRHSKTENFGYDNLNHLTSYAGKTVIFDPKGNLTSRSDAGTFTYGGNSKPYALTEATIIGGSIPVRLQDIDYTSFRRPAAIVENGITASFVYNGEYMTV